MCDGFDAASCHPFHEFAEGGGERAIDDDESDGSNEESRFPTIKIPNHHHAWDMT